MCRRRRGSSIALGIRPQGHTAVPGLSLNNGNPVSLGARYSSNRCAFTSLAYVQGCVASRVQSRGAKAIFLHLVVGPGKGTVVE
jgi:hypothetical protein